MNSSSSVRNSTRTGRIVATQCQDSENSPGALLGGLRRQVWGACAQTHRLTCRWHPGEDDLLPDSPRNRPGGETVFSRGLSYRRRKQRTRDCPRPPSPCPLPLLGNPAPSPFAHPGAAVMDRLGSGILLDPISGTRVAGPGGVWFCWRRQRGRSRWGGRISFLHLGRRRGGKGMGEGVTWGLARAACARHLIRRPAPSSCGAGGREEGRQDGGGEVGRAGRRFCRRRRRLRSCCLRLLTRSRTGRSYSGVGSGG